MRKYSPKVRHMHASKIIILTTLSLWILAATIFGYALEFPALYYPCIMLAPSFMLCFFFDSLQNSSWSIVVSLFTFGIFLSAIIEAWRRKKTRLALIVAGSSVHASCMCLSTMDSVTYKSSQLN